MCGVRVSKTKHQLIDAAADVVCSYLSGNELAWQDVAPIINSVMDTLWDIRFRDQEFANPVPAKLVPAVSKSKSISDDQIYCLDCGCGYKLLTNHLRTVHGTTPAEYRQKWGLGLDYPMVPPNYASLRRSVAISFGFGKRQK